MKRFYLQYSILLLALGITPSTASNTADSQRVSATARSGTVPLGGPAIITWSIVPDGITLP